MSKLTLSALAVSVTLALAGCQTTANSGQAPTKTAKAAQNLPFVDVQYETFTLDNGLRVVVHTDKKAPIVAVNVWYNVGSKHEKEGKTGFAHLFEHLMFNGTENYDDEFFGPFEKVGATEQNGTTNSDRTNYFQNVPTTALDLALWMESDRMGHLLGAITQEKLDEQRGVVQNEKRQGESQPYGKMWSVMAEHTFPKGHPYSWSVIGSMEDLNAASLDDVHQWFKDYYGPSNAVLVLAGDIDVKTAKAKANQFFGDIKPGKPVGQVEAWVAKRNETKRVTMQDRVPAPRILKVWNTAEMGTTDAEYLSLLVDVLAGGKNSRLHKRLVHDEQVASGVWAYNYERVLAGQILVSVDVLPSASIEAVEAIIDEEIKKLLDKGPSQKELDRTRFNSSANLVKELEGVGGFGGKSDLLASGMVYHNNPGYYKDAFAIKASATPDAVRQAGVRWLSSGEFVLTVLPFDKFTHAEVGADRSKLPEVNELPTLDLPDIETTTLSNGLEVVLAKRSDTPTVNLKLEFDAGYAADHGKKIGRADFAMNMLTEGTQSLSGLELAAELEQIGAEISVASNLDTSSIYLDAMTVNWEKAAALFADVVTSPAFNDQDIERLRTLRLDQINKEKSQPQSSALRTLPPLLYGKDHPYGQPLTGSGDENSVTSLTKQDLVEFKETWLRPDLARLIVVGDIDMNTLKGSLEKQLGQWQAPSSAKPEKALKNVAAQSKPRVFVIDKPDSPQSLIISGLLAYDRPSLSENQDIKLDVMNAILGGEFTARVNMNLREDKGWAYGAYTFMIASEGQSPYMVYAPVQTDKTGDAINELLKELNNYVGEKPATEQELQKVVGSKVAELPGRYERKSNLVYALSDAYRKGKTVASIENYGSAVQSITLNDVHSEAKKLIDTNKLTWVIVGDVEKIKAQLEPLKLGDITYLTE
ncbi:Zinc protease [Pseudoalteromonas luteoviolacea B = ATCC 29581]|nr:Zinc protease [Pseudoalteromonas luteoviolacea B = ATCC 29581]